MSLPLLLGVIVFLCPSEAAAAKPELVPSSLSMWNLFGIQLNFANKQTDCVLKNICLQVSADSTATQPPPETHIVPSLTLNVRGPPPSRPSAATPTPFITTVATTIRTVPTTLPYCNKAAHFDVQKNHCVCNDPKMDGRIRDPEKYGAYSEGAVCYDCQNSNASRAVVFILDETGTVGKKGWDAQKEFMLQILGVIGDIKVGVVVIASNSYVAVPMDDYKNNANKISEFVRTKVYEGSTTAVGEALFHARKMLEEVNTDFKNIIIFSDGDEDGCEWYGCEHSQEQEAKEIHKMGVSVTYVAVNYDLGPTRIKMIAGDMKNVVKITDFTALDSKVLNNVIGTVCKVEM